MAENPILAEIHQHREEVARQCDFDAEKLLAYYRRKELEHRGPENPLVSLAEVRDAATVREEPPKAEQ